MTTYAMACAANATSSSTCSSGALLEQELEHADGLPAVGHRREHAGAVVLRLDDDLLGGQRAPRGAPLQRHLVGGLLALRARGRITAGVAEPDERVPAEVRDQERDLVGVQFVREALPEHIRGRERRGVLDGRQQLCEVEMGGGLDHPSLERDPPTDAIGRVGTGAGG